MYGASSMHRAKEEKGLLNYESKTSMFTASTFTYHDIACVFHVLYLLLLYVLPQSSILRGKQIRP